MVGVTRWFGRTAWVVLLAFAATQPGLSQTARKGWDPMEFRKPGDPKLRQTLTQLQYDVTQHDATEPPFRNEYWDNHRPGLYVDVGAGSRVRAIAASRGQSGRGRTSSSESNARPTSNGTPYWFFWASCHSWRLCAIHRAVIPTCGIRFPGGAKNRTYSRFG